MIHDREPYSQTSYFFSFIGSTTFDVILYYINYGLKRQIDMNPLLTLNPPAYNVHNKLKHVN